MAVCIKVPLGREMGLGPSDIVLDGDPVSPPPKREHSPPQISAHVYCGQTAGWVKMPFDMEVGLGPGHIVLDRDLASLQKGHNPQFSATSVVAKRLDEPRWHLAWR